MVEDVVPVVVEVVDSVVVDVVDSVDVDVVVSVVSVVVAGVTSVTPVHSSSSMKPGNTRSGLSFLISSRDQYARTGTAKCRISKPKVPLRSMWAGPIVFNNENPIDG